MKRMVSIRNKTSSEIEFGRWPIPAMGTLHIPYAEYSSVIKIGDVQPWCIDVSMRDIEFKNVSVKDFGAKGDGVSDDTYQVQSAVDYVMGNGGGVVNVPVGVYLVSTITVQGNVMLVGESNVDSIIKSDGTSNKPVITFIGGECGMKTLRVVS